MNHFTRLGIAEGYVATPSTGAAAGQVCCETAPGMVKCYGSSGAVFQQYTAQPGSIPYNPACGQYSGYVPPTGGASQQRGGEQQPVGGGRFPQRPQPQPQPSGSSVPATQPGGKPIPQEGPWKPIPGINKDVETPSAGQQIPTQPLQTPWGTIPWPSGAQSEQGASPSCNPPCLPGEYCDTLFKKCRKATTSPTGGIPGMTPSSGSEFASSGQVDFSSFGQMDSSSLPGGMAMTGIYAGPRARQVRLIRRPFGM